MTIRPVPRRLLTPSRTASRPDEWLSLDGIEFDCTIGVTDRERAIKQKIVVNLRVHVNFSDVKRSDAIEDTVDYHAICRAAITAGERSSFRLIEALAGCLGRTLLAAFPAIREVRVELWKPGALSAAKAVGVTVVEDDAHQERGKTRHSTKMS